ncbi:uncharacterized protein CMU_012440 [Cryptosporidium muris RN66]|uniref:EF-hand domain-containing protein n=1 Tax=Cryptosporidium muris (strain RN66) TaxID=441375 RepID=B6AEF3_CRYMR|nr:uncharacterized protein CMU_012440 [Cryptosporidium muris RN66]EEA06570.1 hypothetical protein CMU_012440 [Cryptosporidium muris RN66]|eukprot:XP_002140919.1 hypothetical protein [Cryptosporidium muris RN66]
MDTIFKSEIVDLAKSQSNLEDKLWILLVNGHNNQTYVTHNEILNMAKVLKLDLSDIEVHGMINWAKKQYREEQEFKTFNSSHISNSCLKEKINTKEMHNDSKICWEDDEQNSLNIEMSNNKNNDIRCQYEYYKSFKNTDNPSQISYEEFCYICEKIKYIDNKKLEKVNFANLKL